jgi:CheY-like chemotaxis protein
MQHSTKPSRSLNVLLVEDVPANQRLVTSILQSHSHEVTVAHDGREAIEHVSTGQFDVVLMDVQMPVMDGYQATETIRAAERLSGRHVPIIAMTSNATRTDRERCRTLGMDAYLSKPIDIEELVAVIDRFAGRHTLQSDHDISPLGLSASNGSEQTLNLDAAMRRLHGDRELYRQFVEVFDEDAPGLIQDLRAASAARDAKKLSRAAHSLRGLAVNLGADIVQRLAAQLEAQGECGDLHSAVDTYGQLLAAFDALHQALQAYR